MNWTEGNLSRHSRGRQRNVSLMKQKQHFAKARNSLLGNGRKQSPISISFHGAQNPRSPARRGEHRKESPRSPSSPMLAERRKSTESSQADVDNETFIREKKRRLLEKSDWAGLNLQQPIDISFPKQLQTSASSRWGRIGFSRTQATQKRREPVEVHRAEASRESHGHPLRIRIGSHEIQPNTSTSPRASTRRYSLEPRPIADLARKKSSPISSPIPSQARQLYVAAGTSQTLRERKGSFRGGARHPGSARFEASTKPPRPEEPARTVYSSSTIHEPTPRRANHFTVLHWSPRRSDGQEGSLQVEIDHPVPSVSSSQAADQQLWRSWLPSSSDNPQNDSPTKSSITGPVVSSSPNTLPPHFQRLLPAYAVPSEPETRTGHVCSVWGTKTSGQEDSQVEIGDSDRQSAEKRSPSHRPQAQDTHDDRAWMKFVFDDNSDEIQAKAFAEAAHQAAKELHPSEAPASMLDATETVATCGTDRCNEGEEDEREVTPGEDLIESRKTGYETVSSDLTSTMATAGSTVVTEPEPRFRFTLPRTFVGKLAFADSNAVTRTPTLLSSNGVRKGKGWRRRRAKDGRADIRLLPDYEDDPIEESGDDQ
ncbi:hypothetical protein GGS23DRAFT_607056 [Durotheca rogersii]|uniref:uncharacterized protein n=1 Tax=Durotheca rogersii TaxID=419775 RepID=UPI00221F2AF8|nr:uncharacterized protein GGS23DRAFT_607056 [Durotheca rogersii]KAI5860049.1 hypothetical protein GGS23DRAFT_607056 [Durotheca rogersii]